MPDRPLTDSVKTPIVSVSLSTGRHRESAGLFLLLLMLIVSVVACPAFGEDVDQTVRIGVLAKRGPERCMEKWSPTAKYLSEQIPSHSFQIVPLGYDEVAPAVERGEVDFVLTNPSLYAEAEALYGGPYKDYGKVTLGETVRNYWYWLAIIAAALAAMGGATAYVLKLNHRLRQARSELENELTERKRAEEQVAVFRQFADASGQGFGMATLDGKLTYVNLPFCRILGEDTSGEALGKYFVSYYSEKVQQRLRDEILPAVLKGEQWVGELDLVSTGGRVIPTTTNFFTICNENDKPVYYAGVFSDITERKQAEEALQSSESKFRTLYEATSDAVMLLDEKSFFDCNDATLQVFGCDSREQFLARHPSELSPASQPDGQDSRVAADGKIATAMTTGTNRFEWMHCRVDGSEFPAEVLLNRLELEAGRSSRPWCGIYPSGKRLKRRCVGPRRWPRPPQKPRAGSLPI